MGGNRLNEVGIILHNPRYGEVGIFMVSVRNSQYTNEYNINFKWNLLGRLSVKWIAYETLLYGKYTTKKWRVSIAHQFF